MSDRQELHYTSAEIRSFLPLGWRLAPGETHGRWDGDLRQWTLHVLDGSSMEWLVAVSQDEAREAGRLAALQRHLGSLKTGGRHRERLRGR